MEIKKYYMSIKFQEVAHTVAPNELSGPILFSHKPGAPLLNLDDDRDLIQKLLIQHYSIEENFEITQFETVH